MTKCRGFGVVRWYYAGIVASFQTDLLLPALFEASPISVKEALWYVLR